MDCTNNLPVLLLYDIDGCWSQDEISESQYLTKAFVDALRSIGHPVTVECLRSNDLYQLLRPYDPDELVIFNWCEEVPGIPYSWASAAEVLEESGFTFTGADSRALALGLDKRQIKRCLDISGIPTPIWQVFTEIHTVDWTFFPAIVKPAFEHSSYAITRESVVQTKEELSKRVKFIIEELQQPAIVEEFIDGREFHVGVIGNGNMVVLPPAEIDFSAFGDIHDRLCTYEANYDKNSWAYQHTIPKIPACLTHDQLCKLEEVASAAYRAASCRDYARMDIRLRDGIFYVLDVNHNADISPDTSFVQAAELIGYSYGKFGSLLINMAAERHPRFKKS